MKLDYFRHASIERLSANAERHLEWYRNGVGEPPWSGSDLLESHIEVPDGEVLLDHESASASSDVLDAIKLFEWLPKLGRDEARDPRLWAALALTKYPAYCRSRWRAPSDDAKAVRGVRAHWFVAGEGLASLRRHALARLWWAVELTHAPWERHPTLSSIRHNDAYVFTRVLLGNQDVYQAFVERRFGSDPRVLVPALEVVRQRHAAGHSAGQEAKKLAKIINWTTRYRELSEVPPQAQCQLYERELCSATPE